jgi:ABC-type Fe3+/spermidine/putrescine transport system ATPase subunit
VAGVRIEGLRKQYGGRIVLEIDALEIGDGEFFSLLGPSGCGKTTTLRCVAGLVDPESGRIALDGRDVTRIPTYRRNLGMVFQGFALFPHLTVAENVAFGLRERGGPRTAVAARVAEALQLVALSGYEARLPHQLSGGEQQRVAMARAVVYRPDVLLLDEPLSSLDVKLRLAMRAELKRLQRTLGITTVFVTHDQQEALAVSDRIAVMRAGRVEQVGTPIDVYESPASVFVADFVGGTNLLSGTIEGPDAAGLALVRLDARTVLSVPMTPAPLGRRVTLTAKPERVLLDASNPTDACGPPGEILEVTYLGANFSYFVGLGSQRLEARTVTPILRDGVPVAAGDRVSVRLPADAVRVFDA